MSQPTRAGPANMLSHILDAPSKLNRLVLLCVITIALLLTSVSAWSAPVIQVIGHSASGASRLDMKLLGNIFKRRIRVDKQGNAYVPVNLPVEHHLRKVFSKILFGQEPEALERYWNEQYFKGISPPFVLSSMEAVRRFVASTPGSIGYILSCQDEGRSDVLASIPLTPHQLSQVSKLCEDIPGRY